MKQKIKCFFGMHDFPNWKFIDVYSEREEIVMTVSRRKCKCCPKVEYLFLDREPVIERVML